MSGVLALMKIAVIADTCCNQLNCLSKQALLIHFLRKFISKEYNYTEIYTKQLIYLLLSVIIL